MVRCPGMFSSLPFFLSPFLLSTNPPPPPFLPPPPPPPPPLFWMPGHQAVRVRTEGAAEMRKESNKEGEGEGEEGNPTRAIKPVL